MHAATSDQPHVVYKFFTDDSDLLYIGSTSASEKRIKHHQRSKPWFKQVAWIETKKYPNRKAAAWAEYSAIAAEHPRYNKYGLGPHWAEGTALLPNSQ